MSSKILLPVSRSWLGLVLAVALISGAARAEPWLAPGDAGLRHDIELLADAGILRGPTTTWPLSWPDIARDLQASRLDGLDAGTTAALVRVRRQARQAAHGGFSGLGARVSASHDPTPFRGFADSPRDEGEVAVQAGWLTDHLALNLRVTGVADPRDGKTLRADGSFLGVNVGNFMVSAGYLDRWWGPGWDGSLILSTSARPIPGVTLERNYTDPFETRWLSWIGPWRASIALGEAESSDVAVPGVRFLAARVNFRPRPWLEVGLSRSAQWCGEGRPCGLDTLGDLLIGRDNEVIEGSVSRQPGNQMAGYDLRLRSPWRRLPLAVYTQWIGEDEAGGLPSKFLGLLGAEVWGAGESGTWRARVEYADTTCSFTREQPEFNCAYRNTLYPQGYTHRGRGIGHSMDNDSRMTSVGGIWTRNGGDSLSLTARRIDLNRDGGPHTISEVPLKINDVELRYSRRLGVGTIHAAVGFDEGDALVDHSPGARGFVTWQQGF